MEELVSIIVPVHNTEKYLKKCLDSLLEQSYRQLEIILIDDGSTDSSTSIVKEYAQNYKNIIYIWQENQGVSVARNTGLIQASGAYVVFVDSDDYVKYDYIEELLQGIKEADMSVCGYYKVNSVEDVIDSNVIGERRELKLSSVEFMENLYTGKNFNYQGYLFNKLFKKEIIENGNIRFDKEIAYNEDRLFILQYLLFAKNVFYNDKPKYMYLQREDSAMGKIKTTYKHTMITELYAFEKMESMLDNQYENVRRNLIGSAYGAAISLKGKSNREDRKEINRYLCRWAYKRVCDSGLDLKNRIKALCVLIMNKIH